jgi:hypothetical protein
MNRSKQSTIAAILAAIVGVVSIADATRILAAGSAGMPAQPGAEAAGGPPFWAGLMFFAMGVAFVFSAYGIWKNQRWGKILAIVLSAINGLFTLGDIIGTLSAQIYALTAVFVVGELVLITIIVLLLQRAPGQSRA